MNKNKETKKTAGKEQPTSLHEQFVNKAEKNDRKTFDREGFLGKGY